MNAGLRCPLSLYSNQVSTLPSSVNRALISAQEYQYVPVTLSSSITSSLCQILIKLFVEVVYQPHPLYPPLHDMDIYSYHEGERLFFEGVDRVASGEIRPFKLP